MANVVTINDKRYFVDVGYGADGPLSPLPLVSGEIQKGLPGRQVMLEYKSLPQHTDRNQRVWVYSHCKAPGVWEEIYHFPDVEFFALDFDVLNHYTMAQGLFSRIVVVQRFIFSTEADRQEDIVGSILLLRDTLKEQSGLMESVIKVLQSEEERLAVLENYFNIVLKADQRQAIKGFESEIKIA
jgi:arylamine N-acetyltransferase